MWKGVQNKKTKGYITFSFIAFFYHNSGKNKLMARQIHSNIKHKFQMMMMIVVIMIKSAEYCAEKGRRYCSSRYCCSVLSWLSACFEALGLCRY